MLIASFAGIILNTWEKKGNIDGGYATLFIVAGSAYLIAWILMYVIGGKMKTVNLDE